MKTIIWLSMLATWSAGATAQSILIDRGLKAGSLWCFPSSQDSLRYYYLPSAANLAATESGQPGFSFLRYASLKENGSDRSISASAGGALLHFLVTCETSREQLAKAKLSLQKKVSGDVKLVGPVIFKSARYALVSSTLQSDSTRQYAKGEAPVLENSRLAFSFGLAPLDAQLLLESFKSGTSDLSVVFDFTFEGLADAYKARLEVDWAKTNAQLSAHHSARIFSLGLDVKNEIDSLLRNEAIRIVTSGADVNMEALANRAYDRILGLLYEPVQETQIEAKPDNDDDSGKLHSASITKSILNIRSAIPIALNSTYKRKTLRTEGKTVYDFNAHSVLSRHHFVTFNLGNVYEKYGSDTTVFRQVALDESPFRQRQISINVDGSVGKEMNGLVNHLTVTIRKIHQDSSVTVKELLVDKAVFSGSTSPGLSYLNQHDTDPLLWLEYEYRLHWQLAGGGQVSTDWIKTNAPIINILPPEIK